MTRLEEQDVNSQDITKGETVTEDEYRCVDRRRDRKDRPKARVYHSKEAY